MYKNILNWFLFNILGKLVPPLIGFITIPYLLGAMGAELFGEFGAVITLLLLLSILDFGVSKSIVKDVASSRGEILDISGSHTSVFWQCYAFQFFIGFIGALLVWTISHATGLNDSAGLIDLNSWIHTLCFLVFIPIIVASGVSRAFFEGRNRFKELNLIRAFFSIAVYLSPLFALYVIKDQYFVVVLVLALKVCESVILTIIVCLRENLIGLPEKSTKYIRLLMPFGLWVMFSNLITPMIAYGERFVVIAVLGLSSFSIYYIAIEVVTKTLIIVGSLATATFSLESKLKANGSDDYSLDILKYIVACFYIFFAVTLYFEAGWLLEFWLADEYTDKLTSLIHVLSIGLIFNAVGYTLLNSVYSSGRSFNVFLSYSFQLPIYLISIYFSLRQWGVVGVAYCWVVRVIIDFIVMWVFAYSDSNKKFNYLFNFLIFIFMFSICVFALFSLVHYSVSFPPMRLPLYLLIITMVFISFFLLRKKGID